MKKTYTTILFDFDGTIADSTRCIVDSFQQTLAAFNRPPLTEAALIALIGKPLVDQVRILIPDSSSEEFFTSFVAKFREIYAIESQTKITVFRGMKKLLSNLKTQNIATAIVSSKKESVLQNNCRTLHIYDYFTLFVGPDSVTHHKPHPETVEVSLKKLGVHDRTSVLVIGDTTFDVEMGNSAFVDTCAVTWGVHPKNTLLAAKPTYLVEKVSALHTLLYV